MKEFFDLYLQYSCYFDPFILFIKTLVYVNFGFACKKIWGRSKITLAKFISGSLFISICIVSVNKIIPLGDGFLTLSSIFMGYGADNIMLKFLKQKYWEKFNVIDKLDKDKKE